MNSFLKFLNSGPLQDHKFVRRGHLVGGALQAFGRTIIAIINSFYEFIAGRFGAQGLQRDPLRSCGFSIKQFPSLNSQ